MKTLGNILWHFPFFGFVSAILVYLLGLLLTATVVAAPVGLGLMEFGRFLFWPFGNAMVSKGELNVEQNKAWKVYSTIVMVIYFPFGLLLCIGAIFQVVFLFLSIIGIPAALVVAKSLGTYLNPVNKKCVHGAVKDELERRKAQQQIDKHLGTASNVATSTTGETPIANPQPQVQQLFTQTETEQPKADIGETASKSINAFGDWATKNKKGLLIGGGLIIALAIVFYAVKFFLGLIAGPDAFIGDWTSYNGDIKITKQDKIYQIDFLDNTGQTTQTYQANKVDDLLSYRDNSGNGKQIEVYVPVNTNESKEGKIILDYKDSLNIRLITHDGDYFKKIEVKNEYRLNGYEGTWYTKTTLPVARYNIFKVDSTSEGIQVAWLGNPDELWTELARFKQGMLNINEMGVDGGIYATYFQDCDCITIGNDKYYRYHENDEKFLGYWKNNNGEIKISKNGNYYLVRSHQFQDYTFDFMTEVQGNTLKEPFNKYANGKTYTTITFLSPGVISDNGGETKYYNSSKYSRSNNYSYGNSNNSNNTNQSTTPTTTTKSFSGNVGKLLTSYSLTWNSDGTIFGIYYYPNKPNTTYTLRGKDLGNGNIQLTEYTGSNVSANCNLSLQGNCYVGQMNNTDGRTFKMTMCQ